MKFKVRYALGGGFGGIKRCEPEILEFKSQEKADEYAYQCAVDEYESCSGMHGLRSIEDIMEEEDITEDEAYQEYLVEMESWLDYEAVLMED